MKRQFKIPHNSEYYAKKFWERVKKGQPEECWEWQGARSEHDYGVAWTGERTIKASRWAWELTNGAIQQTGLCVCHRCDNPPCCNPGHLFLGTKKVNTQDMVTKGRARGGSLAGSNNPCSKLTEDQVRQIRAKHVPRKCGQRALGLEFGVSSHAIYQIIHRKKWRHV